MQRYADQFVAHANRPVPRAMLGREKISLIFRRKLFAIVESNSERCVVRVQQDVGRDDLVLEFGMLALVPGILMAAHVPPGPAVEAALLHMGDVVGNQVVAQSVAFVDRAPQLAGLRIRRKPHAVANAVGVNLHARAVGIELQNVGAVLFRRRGIRVVDIGGRAHGDEHFLAIERELNITCGVAAAGRQVGKVLRPDRGPADRRSDRGSARPSRCCPHRPTADSGPEDKS